MSARPDTPAGQPETGLTEDGTDAILIEGLLVAAEIGILDSEKGQAPGGLLRC
ncbi:hypothetical protein QW131_20875 [Roseibium salinum]|nr:hypothetical protein [Roseibium salinum]